jgi:hypothetical protein
MWMRSAKAITSFGSSESDGTLDLGSCGVTRPQVRRAKADTVQYCTVCRAYIVCLAQGAFANVEKSTLVYYYIRVDFSCV